MFALERGWRQGAQYYRVRYAKMLAEYCWDMKDADPKRRTEWIRRHVKITSYIYATTRNEAL